MELKGIQFLTLCLAACISVGFANAPKKIINGQRALQRQFRHQVSLQMNNDNFCGGSIISSIHILTAAHCVVNDTFSVKRPEDISVITGVIDYEDRKKDNVFRVSSISYHAGYNPENCHNDIAILTLKKEIPFNSYQSMISLPTEDTPAGKVVEGSGWGVGDHPVGDSVPSQKYLQHLRMTTVGLDDCRPFYDDIYDGSICAKSAKNTGMCSGDSGGPLTYKGTVVGIASYVASRGKVVCATGPPDVYTRVYYFLPWIKMVIGQTSTS